MGPPSPGFTRRLLFGQGECARGTEAHRALHLRAERLRRALIPDDHLGFPLVYGEDLGRLLGAGTVALTQVEVDPNPHATAFPGRRRYLTRQGWASCTTILEWSLR